MQTVDGALIRLLAGMPNCAQALLDHPEKYVYPSVARYAESMAWENGRSLTLPELLQIAENLEIESSRVVTTSQPGGGQS